MITVTLAASRAEGGKEMNFRLTRNERQGLRCHLLAWPAVQEDLLTGTLRVREKKFVDPWDQEKREATLKEIIKRYWYQL